MPVTKKGIRLELDQLIHRFLFIRMLDDERKIISLWQISKPEGVETLNEGASFFSLVDRAFNQLIVIELCKIIKGETSLCKWLNRAKSNCRDIEPSTANYDTGERIIIQPREYNAIVDSNLAQLEMHFETITNLFARRNKVYAHMDKEFLENPDEHFSRYPLNSLMIDELMNTISDILREQGVYMLESDIDTTTVYTVHNLERVLQFVRGFYRAQHDKELQDKGIYIMRYKWDEVRKPTGQ